MYLCHVGVFTQETVSRVDGFDLVGNCDLDDLIYVQVCSDWRHVVYEEGLISFVSVSSSECSWRLSANAHICTPHQRHAHDVVQRAMHHLCCVKRSSREKRPTVCMPSSDVALMIRTAICSNKQWDQVRCPQDSSR